MTPIVPVAVSLFGAPTGVVPILNSAPDLMSASPADPIATFSTAAAPLAGVPSAPFADLITEAVGQVQHLEQQAQASIEGLISGKGVDVHEAMIATQKAGMGFELVLSVRNKALAAYQQVMGMQF